jgi:hypothetical protein
MKYQYDLPDINPVQCSWTCLLVTDEARAVCYNDNTSDYHRLMVCSRDVQMAMQTMHQVYNSLRGKDTHIHHSYATRVWCAEQAFQTYNSIIYPYDNSD